LEWVVSHAYNCTHNFGRTDRRVYHRTRVGAGGAPKKVVTEGKKAGAAFPDRTKLKEMKNQQKRRRGREGAHGCLRERHFLVKKVTGIWMP